MPSYKKKTSLKNLTKGLSDNTPTSSAIQGLNPNAGATISDRPDPGLIQIPNSFFPHANFENAIWFKLTARELVGQRTGQRGGTLQVGRKGATFKFLAPQQIIDNHQHTWEEYQSIQSRLLQYVISGKIAVDQLTEVYKNLKNEFVQHTRDGDGNFRWPTGEEILAALKKAPNVGVPKYKQDTPLRYTGSSRRTYQLTFILADADGGEYMQSAVELLQKYAAPEATSDISIEFPYIFTIETDPIPLINVQYAALETIMTTWMHPYIKGRPSRCELQLNFKDMSPLFKGTIERGGIVNVIDTTADDYSFANIRDKSTQKGASKPKQSLKRLTKGKISNTQK